MDFIKPTLPQIVVQYPQSKKEHAVQLAQDISKRNDIEVSLVCEEVGEPNHSAAAKRSDLILFLQTTVSFKWSIPKQAADKALLIRCEELSEAQELKDSPGFQVSEPDYTIYGSGNQTKELLDSIKTRIGDPVVAPSVAILYDKSDKDSERSHSHLKQYFEDSCLSIDFLNPMQTGSADDSLTGHEVYTAKFLIILASQKLLDNDKCKAFIEKICVTKPNVFLVQEGSDCKEGSARNYEWIRNRREAKELHLSLIHI